jgi:hypothetical protein
LGQLKDELLYYELTWVSTEPTLLEEGEPGLLANPVGQPGDQRQPAMAATPLPPEGAVAVAYESYEAPSGTVQGEPDVFVQLRPVPFGIQDPDAGGGS